MSRVWSEQTWSGHSLNARGVPRSIHGASQGAEGNTLRNESLGSARRDCASNGLKVCGHLAGEHFDEARAVHADGLALIGKGLLGDETPALVQGTFGGEGIAVIERNEIKALAENKNAGCAIAAASGGWKIVATRAGVRVRAGKAIEIERENERTGGVRKTSAVGGSLGKRAACAFLSGPPRSK